MADITLWGIHAGRTGDADTLFLEQNVVAIGWQQLGDPSAIPANRNAFKTAFLKAYPESKPGAVPTKAGQIFRFIHEMKKGDLIAYPSKQDRHIHLGRITGDYRYDPSLSPGYPNLRPAEWLKAVPRTSFSQGALFEIGSAMSLFQIKNYAEEYLAAVENRPTVTPVEADETVAEVAEDIEETTRDFILKTLAQELKGHPFTQFVAHLLEAMGYRTRISPEGPDGGIDIVAHRDELGFEPPIIKVQIKSSEGKIGHPDVSALVGNISPNEHGLLITLGTFTAQATAFARGKSNLRLIDGDSLIGLILAHYEQFDSRYKGILPLKRVYVPESRIADQS